MSSVAVERTNWPPRRWFWVPRSFRVLVTAWNTLILIVFTLLILIGLRYGLSYMLVREEDQLLAEDADEVCLAIDRVYPGIDRVQQVLDRKADSHLSRKWFCVVRNGDGVVLAQSRNVPDINLPSPMAVVPKREEIGSYRIAHHRYHIAGAEPLSVFVGASTEQINEDITRATQTIIFVGTCLLFLAPIGGYWLAGRVIKPLANIITTTARLRPSNLDERLPIRETGDELDQLSMTINSLLDRIGEHLSRHRDLTANAAHELRSPLTAILSSAEVALNQERSPDEYKDLLGSIVDECSRLGTLVQQLLLLAESDAGRLEGVRERVRLDQIVQKAVDMFQGVAESRSASLEAHIPESVEVMGDAGQLRQVALNLLDNAIKFTPGGFVHVQVRNEGGKALLIVTDTGAGIPPEHLPHVFDRFYRGDQSRTRLATGGSGLGLSICQALVTAHGGTIAVQSEVGRGTEVRVVLATSAK